MTESDIRGAKPSAVQVSHINQCLKFDAKSLTKPRVKSGYAPYFLESFTPLAISKCDNLSHPKILDIVRCVILSQ